MFQKVHAQEEKYGVEIALRYRTGMELGINFQVNTYRI